MKILIPFLFVLVFSLGITAQNKPPIVKAETPKISANDEILKIRIAARLNELQIQKIYAESRKRTIVSTYGEQYPESEDASKRIKELDAEILELKTNPEKYQLKNVLNESVDDSFLLKITILQNEKIIELLEKLVNKK